MEKAEFLRLFPALVEGYQPAPDVLRRIGSVSLLMIIGASGSGKTTLIKELGLPYVPADTTRPQRPEEQNGKDYYFRTDYQKIMDDIKAGRFVQIANPDGEFYSTRDSSYPESGIAVMAVIADAVPVFRGLGFKETFSAFLTPPSYDEWLERMNSREMTPDKFSRRLEEARRSYGFALSDAQTHFILSDNIESTHNQASALLRGQVDPAREELARKSASQILTKLNSKDDK